MQFLWFYGILKLGVYMEKDAWGQVHLAEPDRKVDLDQTIIEPPHGHLVPEGLEESDGR